MKLNIIIDRSIEIPIYRQVVEQIAAMIRNGDLVVGDKLPPERELAYTTNISRGTITKAYEELEKNKLVEIIQGSGCFVADIRNILQQEQKQQALILIDKLISDLEHLNLSYTEIRKLTNFLLLEKERRSILIAAIDCNPEALAIYTKQLSRFSNIVIKRFLLDKIIDHNNPEELFDKFDLILTTSTHYIELSTMLPNCANRMLQAAVSPNQRTIIELATLPPDITIGVICISHKFLSIIKDILKSFKIDSKSVHHVFDNEKIHLISFLDNMDVIIVPPDSSVENENNYNYIQKFKEKGGKIVKFEYQIERGSLLYIEDQISYLQNKKNSELS